MTRERAKELLPVIEAYAKGEVIECRDKYKGTNEKWQLVIESTFHDDVQYRIQPKPLEKWLLICGENEQISVHGSEEGAKAQSIYAGNSVKRIVHMREVT